MTYYIDRETGQRVKKSTWTRSKAQGGTRYCRKSVSPSPSSSKHKKEAPHARVRKVRKTTAKKPATKKSKLPRKQKNGSKKGGTSRTMYRLTVAAPFSVRTGKKKNDYASAAAMFRAWYRRYPSEQKIDDAIEAARELRDQEATANKGWHHDEEPNVEVKKVPYDPNFIDTTEETTDLP